MKNKRTCGGGYILVLTAAALIMLLVTAALAVTAMSRRITARYAQFAGLYDLAVAGNEQVLHLIRNAVNDNRATIIASARGPANADGVYPPVGRAAFIREAMPFALAAVRGHYTFVAAQGRYRGVKTLTFSITRDGANLAGDSYRVTTEVTALTDSFRVETTVHRIPDWDEAAEPLGPIIIPARVGAYITWPVTIIYLDDYTVAMVQSMRIAD